MGRRESPVDPAEGPVQRLAYELRKLRQEADGLTYRAMARRAGYSITTLSQAAGGERLASLEVVLAYVQVCGGDPADWEERWHRAKRELAQEFPEDEGAAGPYPGLSSYGVQDAHLFFGRDRLVGELLELLTARRFAAVFGPSGSGKSSLLRAGLTAALGKARPGGSPGRIEVITPGEHPMRHAELFHPAEPGSGPLVIVDQFEEVFTLCPDQDERTRFIDLLLTPESGIRVVLAVRADFYGRCAEHRKLAEALRDANLLVGPMDREELRDAILRPAMAEGLTVERTLTAEIIADVADEPGALPLMSHALRETWRRRRGRLLTLETYRDIGRVHGAISHTAEILYGRLTPEQAKAARRILLRLITPGGAAGDTRRPASRTELDPGRDADTSRIIELLAGARLLTLHHDTVELAHEALIASWPRLRRWVDEDRDRLTAQRQLTQAAEAWERHGHDPGTLYRGARLEVVGRLLDLPGHHDDLTPLERDFLRRSTAQAKRESRRRVVVSGVLAVLVVLATTAAGIALSQTDFANAKLDEAMARVVAHRVAAVRVADPATARRLSVAAWRIAPVPEARDQLIDSVIDPATDVFTDPNHTEGSVQALNADGTRLAVFTPGPAEGESGTLRIHDVEADRETARVRWTGERAVRGLAVSPDGRTVAVASTGGTQLWRVGETAPPGPAFGPKVDSGGYDRLEFGPGGDLLIIDAGHAVQTWDVHRAVVVLTEPVVAVDRSGRLALVIPRAARELFVTEEHSTVVPISWRAPLGVRRVELWDLRRGKRIPAPWLPATAGSGTFSPDGRSLALSGRSGVRLFDVDGGDERTAALTPSAERVTFSSDGRFLAGVESTGSIHLWRAGDATHLKSAAFSPSGSITAPRVSADGRLLRVTGAFGAVHTFDVARHTRPVTLGPGDGERRFSPDGRLLAVADDQEHGWRVRVFDVARRAPLGAAIVAGRPRDHRGAGAVGPYHPVFGPDGRTLALTHPESPTTTLWDVLTGTRLGEIRLRRAGARVTGTAFSPDGRIVAFGVHDPEADYPEVELWDVAARTWIRSVPAVGGAYLAFGRDGRRLYAGDGFYGSLIDTASGTVARPGPDVRARGVVLFTAEGAVTGDGSGRLAFWDPGLREQVGSPLNTGSGAVGALVASRSGLIASLSGRDEVVRLWDPRGVRPVGSPIMLPTESRPAVAFHGDTLLVSSPDGTLHEIPVNPEAVAAGLCDRDGDLSAAEWRRHIPELPYRPCR
ncbi:helix-turn-helix domain-containing protein [Rhizohabitans arisaemae]|uniref:nSTAND1 domain-containing NTPase n=1 Tax=Rhizohabitans arisaemae TaxID=2720610 RepID=UPI0024B0E45B|nr:helix-turn-helix domain-containing protein [Rhizohabitans arisaemae]